MTVIFHRGRGARPGTADNSTEALRATAAVASAAHGQGIGLEVDVRWTGEPDPAPILAHDASTPLDPDDPSSPDVTYAYFSHAELRRLLGRRCPILLEDALRIIDPVPRVIFELKEPVPTDRTLETIARHRDPRTCTIASFLPTVVRAAVAHPAPFASAALLDHVIPNDERSQRSIAERTLAVLRGDEPEAPHDRDRSLALLQQLRSTGAPVYAPRWSLLTPTLLDGAERDGAALSVWTVNHPDLFQHLATDRRVLDLITDRPALGIPQLHDDPSRWSMIATGADSSAGRSVG